MGFLSHRVERNELEAGDHIYTWRTAYIYSHNGIYIGGDKVVHFTQHQNSNSGVSTSICFSSSVTNAAAACLDFPDCCFGEHIIGVVKSCLNCFLGNGSLYRYEYGVNGVALITRLRSGTCTTAKSDPPEDVIHKAMHLLQNGFGKYDVFSNNCEDFALYCKTGLVVCARRGSGGSGQVSSVVGLPVAAILSLLFKLFVSNPVVLGATAVLNYNLNRYATDVGVRHDVIKVEAEAVAAFHGNLPPKEDADDPWQLKAEAEGVAAFHGNLPPEEDADIADDPWQLKAKAEGVAAFHRNLPPEEDADIADDPWQLKADAESVAEFRRNLPPEEDAEIVNDPWQLKAEAEGVAAFHGNLPPEEDADIADDRPKKRKRKSLWIITNMSRMVIPKMFSSINSLSVLLYFASRQLCEIFQSL